LHPSPGKWDEKAGRRGEKEYHPDPVNLSKFGEKRPVLLVKLEEDGDQGSPQTEERKVDPKYPSPTDIL
jgi:hypothetical protein